MRRERLFHFMRFLRHASTAVINERVSSASRPDDALLCNVLTFDFDQRPDFAALISLICAAIKV